MAGTGRTQATTSVCAALALVPFAAALGIDLYIGLSRTVQNSVIGHVAGALFALAGFGAWFGWGWYMKRHRGADARLKAAAERNARETPPLHSRIEQMLTEARVILPGAQALLGFQLAIVFTETFEKLPDQPRLLHGAALLSVALSVALLMTPAAIHRIVWAGEDSEALLRTGGRITVLALLPLAFGMAGDSYVVLSRIIASAAPTAAAASLVLLILVGLWFAWPSFERWGREKQFVSRSAPTQQTVAER